MRSGLVKQRLYVLLLIAGLLALAAALAPEVGTRGPHTHPALVGLLAAAFMLTEIVVLHIQVHREAETISLSELPLVLGLLFVSPVGFAIARVAGPLVAFVLVRRQSPIKTAFNVALQVAETAAGLATFHWVAGEAGFPDIRTWFAIYAAIAATSLVSGLAVPLAIAAYEGHLPLRAVLWDNLTYGPIALLVGTVGLLAAYPLLVDGRTGLLLLVEAGVVTLAYRAYASLSDRHLSLERLYRFSHAVSRTPEVDEILRSLLLQAKELLRSEHAEVILVGSDADSIVRLWLGAADRVQRETSTASSSLRAMLQRVMSNGEPLLAPRTARSGMLRAYLDETGSREAILVPLHGDSGVVGTLCVANRMGEVRTYEESDVRLLGTVANHGGVALQNSRLIDRLRHESLHDALTGLPNRVMLSQRLVDELARLDAGDERGFAVMIVDLDGFKDVNDTLGHQHGDELLRDVAQRLTEAAGPGALVARLGGDEFALLLPGLGEEESALATGRRLLERVRHPVVVGDLTIEVGGSFGISLAPLHGHDPSGLLKRADVAMYSAKAARAGVRLYDANLDTASPQRLALVSELRAGIPGGQLAIYVQPKAALPTGAVVGVEALVRWQHPVHGLMGPDQFIPLAERNDLIGPLTNEVLSEALAGCAQWRSQGHELSVAVNVSARTLLDPRFPDAVAAQLEARAVPPQLLTLEITESSVMTDPENTMAVLERLNRMGVHLSVDDFGTGYSSLSYLKRLPVQEVKIDRSFVQGIDTDTDDETIVRSIIDLGANLSLEVVAEGVETEAGWNRLVALGCDAVQGYYLSRPLPLADFLPWLRKYAAAASIPTQRTLPATKTV